MSGRTVTPDGLEDAFVEMVSEFVAEVNDDTREAVAETAEELVDDLKAASPKRAGKGGGRYAKGWEASIKEKATGIEAEIGNAKVPGLSHLLEKGHAKVSGGRVPGQPHIAPAFERADAKLKARLK